MAHDKSEFWHSATADRLGIDNTPDDATLKKVLTVYDWCILPAEEYFKARATITSGYRAPKTNANVRHAASKSQHCIGEAIDSIMSGVSNEDYIRWLADNVPYDQLIYEQVGGRRWIHISCKVDNPQDNRGEIRRTDDGVHYPLMTRAELEAL